MLVRLAPSPAGGFPTCMVPGPCGCPSEQKERDGAARQGLGRKRGKLCFKEKVWD